MQNGLRCWYSFPMSENDNIFRNTLATNGLARGYATRPHKRKRKGLRFSVVALLLALAGVVYFQTATNALTKKEFNERLELAEKVAAQRCLVLMEEINIGLTDVYTTQPDVSERTLRLIEAFDGYCKNL